MIDQDLQVLNKKYLFIWVFLLILQNLLVMLHGYSNKIPYL
jgi:hypothetical protein